MEDIQSLLLAVEYADTEALCGFAIPEMNAKVLRGGAAKEQVIVVA